jgi:hypothetical protein
MIGIGIWSPMLFGCSNRDSGEPNDIEPVPFESLFEPLAAITVRQAEDHPIAAPADLVVMRNKLVIVDALQADLKMFDTTGNFLGTIGRPGSGPGEFKRPLRAVLGPSGDLFVMDPGRGVISRWDTGGVFLSEQRLASSMDDLEYVKADTRLIVGGTVVEGSNSDANLAIHEFDQAGDWQTSYRPRPTLETSWAQAFSELNFAIVGSVVVSGFGLERELHLYDRATGSEEQLSLGAAALIPDPLPTRPMSRMEVIEWMEGKAVLGRIMAWDHRTFIVQFGRVSMHGASGYRYLVGKTDPVVTTVTDWTENNILQVYGRIAFGVTISSTDGAVQVQRFVLPDDPL